MSPTIPILSTLLLTLILGSTEGGQRMESVSSLRQTLQYWRKIYKMYIDEVTLGYCWGDYLLKISNEWPMNLSTLIAVLSYISSSAGATQFNEIHPREKRWLYATAKSAISKFTNNPDKHQITLRSKMIQKQREQIMNKTEEDSQIVPNNYTKWNGKIDENERIARMIDSHIKRRRRAVSMPELLRDERETLQDGHEFSSRGTSSHAVNPTPNPRDDDKVDSGSTDLGEEDSRRKVLRSLTSHRDSFVEDAFASRSFSLKVAREGSSADQRFPFRRYLPSRKRNSRVVETLSDPWMQEDHRVKGNPAGRRASLNNDGSSSALSRSQFRRVNTDTKRSRVSVVKLMDSEGNSSSDLTINSTMSRRKPEELSRDLLLSPHGGSAIAERSLFEFRGSGGDALKGTVLAIQNGQRKRREETTLSAAERSGEFKERKGRFNDTSVLFVGAQKTVPTNALRKSLVFPRPDDSAEIEASRRPHSRVVRNVFSLSNVEQFNRDYENSTSQLIQHSKPIVSQKQPQLFDNSKWPITSSIYSFIVTVFRALGMFVHVGRYIINVVQTNELLVCTREYIWTKIIKWIDNESLMPNHCIYYLCT